MIHRDQYEFEFPKKKRDGTWETEEEMIKRVDKERKKYEMDEYNENITRIMKNGFNMKQAKYLYELERIASEPKYHPAPIYG